VVLLLHNVDKMNFSDVEKVRPLCSCAALLLHYHSRWGDWSRSVVVGTVGWTVPRAVDAGTLA
jgi:hypothetical protein